MLSFASAVTLLLAFVSGVVGVLPVVGAPGSVYPRYEIRTLATAYPRQWSLYIQAMQAFQADPTSEVGSWYQVGGIHGLPNVPWDGVAQTAPGTGYCVHSSNLFPTWHRPYLALFEQQMVAHAKTIAATYPASIRAAWQQAATQLRLPYWDWAQVPASGQPSMPTWITSQTLQIQLPSGLKTVNNPLYSYKMPVQVPGFAQPWKTWPNTLRWPTSNATTATSQDNLAVASVDNSAANQRYGLYQWFTNCPTYLEMSNDLSSSSTAGCPISLESLHNNIHVQTGGSVSPQGHMTIVPYSAFEPLFMLHHAQIDRLFAMWQVLYPTSYTPNQVSNISTFTIQKGSVQGPTSNLKPFHRDANGSFWTSTLVRNTTVFNYVYPELQSSGNSPSAMRAIVNKLYGSGTTTAKKAKRRDHILERRVHIPKGLRAANGSSFEYNANIATSRFGLGGSYSIFVFFSNPTNPDPSTWSYDPALVGSYGVFSSPGMESSNVVTTSAVPLSLTLAQKVANGELADLTLQNVIPYLKANIQWRVVGLANVEIDPSLVPDLEISVVCSTLMPPVSVDAFPVWSKFFTLRQVTRGKPGGL